MSAERSPGQRAQSIFLGIIATILVIYVFKTVSELVLPIVIAILLARLFEPIVSFFKKRKLPLALGIFTVLLCAGLLFSVVAVIGAVSANQVAKELPQYADKADVMLHEVGQTAENLMANIGVEEADIDLSNSIDPEAIISVITAGFSSAMSFITTSLLILFLMLMVIAGQEAMFKAVKTGYGEERHKKVVGFFDKIDDKVQGFLVAKTLVNLITAVATFFVLFFFGLDLAFVFAVLTFFLSYIPAIGGLASFLLPIGLSVLQFDNTGLIIGMIAALLVVNTIIDRFVEPQMLGQSLDLSPLIVFVSFLLFTWMWGTIGAILAVPITAIIKAAFEATPNLKPVALIMGTGK